MVTPVRAVLVLMLLGAATTSAADREFTRIVNAISREFHTRPTHLPMFGFVNVAMFVARPEGMRHLDFATFEHLNSSGRAGGDLPRAILEAAGSAWKPFVQVFSRRKGEAETVFVFMRPDGEDCRLLVASVEKTEATVVQMKLNAKALSRWLSEPRGSALSH
jgi:hypothetical protein